MLTFTGTYECEIAKHETSVTVINVHFNNVWRQNENLKVNICVKTTTETGVVHSENENVK